MAKKLHEIFCDNIPNMTEQVFANWLPRMIVGGCDFNDVMRIRAKVTHWNDWPGLWAEQGDIHLALAEQEMAAGHTISAAASYHRAAMYYHYGHFMLFDRLELKDEMYKKSREILAKALPIMRYPGKAVTIPFGDKKIPAILRENPEANGRMVYHFGGADANKEEMISFSNYFLDRGVSVLIVDNPGQGEAVPELPYTKANFDGAVKAVLAYMRSLGYSKFAVGGISFGGFLGPRAAAVCPDDFLAAFGCGGPYKLNVSEMGPLFFGDFGHVMQLETDEQLFAESHEVSIDDVIKNLTCPLMIVHGVKDTIARVDAAEQFVKNSSSKEPRLIILEDGNHVCNNYVYKYRPLIADWVVDHLSQ